jgi:hypothetical protein
MKFFSSLATTALALLSITMFAPPLTTPVAVAEEVIPQVPCASASILVNPTIVKRGKSVSITGKFKNCSTDTRRYKLTFKLDGPDSFNKTIGPFTVSVPQNKAYSRKVSVTVPSFAPTGRYSATVLVRSTDGTLLDSASATLTVTK